MLQSYHNNNLILAISFLQNSTKTREINSKLTNWLPTVVFHNCCSENMLPFRDKKRKKESR